ncbi:hypothetical protein EBAPG3_007100 [Nitrosospira lacus]|uniref:Uncharacterized protein n=2 Tax=Nitrosospira lacus TaxID=1288494 RepID=A0A1W6SP18_9PROT|nr:hypothetical protein EBAPG3_007100 [Nitrosospira lacus]
MPALHLPDSIDTGSDSRRLPGIAPFSRLTAFPVCARRFSCGVVAADRIQVSEGTVPAWMGEADDGAYASGAILPAQPWRALRPAEVTMLTQGAGSARSAALDVVRLPEFLSRQGRKLFRRLKFCTDESQFAGALDRADYSHLLGELGQFAAGCGGVRGSPLVRISRPNSRVLTQRRDGCRIGLHVDDWFARDGDDRASLPGRLCINLGEEVRYLLMLNLPLTVLHSNLPANLATANMNLSGTPLARFFMTRFPRYPVLKIAIEPGEGYVLASENIIHDGSTEGTQNWDIAIHFLGNFGLPDRTGIHPTRKAGGGAPR